MRKSSHENLIQLDSVYETENSFYMVLELFQGGNLKSLISRHGALSLPNCTTIMRAILKALLHLKQNNILHRDIKPENILFRNNSNSSGRIREEDVALADFGFAVLTTEFPFHHPRCGTPGYVAPEILKMRSRNSTYGHSCDIFSLGITFFHMLCGRLPYEAKNCNELLEKNEGCKFFLESKHFKSNPAGIF
jgi:calcium-dependent protein kinase